MKPYRLAFSILAVAFGWGMFSAGVAQAASWYVDNSITSSGNGTSWTTAWKLFSNINWNSINPGDTVYISGGSVSKTYTQALTVGKSGTPTNRITIRVGQDAGHNGMVTLNGVSIDSVYQNYITIDGSVGTNSRLQIQNVTDASKDNGWAIDAGGVVGLTVRYVTITNCNNGIYLAYGDDFEIDHNSITTRGDVGIRNIMSPDRGWDQNLIHDNSLISLFNGGGPDTIQVGDSTSIYNNNIQVVQDASALSGQHTDNLQLAGRYIKVYGNTFTNIGDSNIDFDAWSGGAIRDLYIYNNLFHIANQIDPYPEFIRMYSTGDAINTFSNVKILNNTFIDDVRVSSVWPSGLGISFRGGTGSGTGNEIKNNLMRTSSSRCFATADGGGSFAVSLSNNIYPNSQSQDPSAIIGVPSLNTSFVPTASDTLARDHGATLSYFSTDKLGTARPQGSAWDIGAYEYINLAPDTTPPTSPTNLAATSPSQSSISVSWNPATDNVGVANYIIERCQGSGCSTFSQVGTPTASPFVDSGLTANTFYNYHVRATDAAGNLSGWSNVVGATTQAPDTQAPTAPSNLTATTASSSTVNLTWTASTDNVGVTGYKVERCSGSGCTTFTQVGTPTTTSYSDTGLSASTLYRYQVRAVDGAGNNSGYSTIVSATTQVAPPSPTFVSEYETPWNTATSPKTTANFSVQSGDTLVAYALNESGSAITTPPTGTLTGTWTLRQTLTTSGFTALRLWTMNVSSNQTNVNVTFTNSGGNFGGDVLHFRNASGIGVTAQANSTTGNPTLTMNGVGDNSTIVMVNGDWTAKTGARTYNTTQAGAFTETSAYADGSSYGVEAGYYGNAGASGNKTIGITAPSGMTWALAAVEVKGNPSAGPVACNTVTTTNFSTAAYDSYGSPFDAFQTSTNLISAHCTSSDTHTIQATLGVTGDTTRIVYTKGYYYAGSAWTQYSGTCTGALNGEWCQGSVSATITNPNISTASAASPAYFVGMTCSVQGGGWKCGCRDTTCSNFYWMVQGAGM